MGPTDDSHRSIRILVGIRTLRYRFPTPGLLASRIQSRREMAAGKNTDPYEIAKDKYCTVHFQPVRTKALRLTAQLQEGKSAGILNGK